MFAVRLGDDLAGVFDNDLVRFERPVAADSIPAIHRFDDLDTNVVLAACLRAMLELLKIAIPTVRSQSAIAVVAFVEHVPVLTIFVATCILRAHASRELRMLVRLPEAGCLANKDIYTQLVK
jgi:hypothetical protein